MNHIEQLIAEHCPDGVPHKPLGDVGRIVRGKRFVKTDMISAGVPCLHYGEIYTKYGVSATEAFSFVSEDRAKNLRFAQQGDVILAAAGETVEDIGKAVAWLGEDPIAIHDACYSFSSSLEPVYVAYFFASAMFRDQIRRYVSSSKISSISTQNLSKALIPLPPLEVQREIVRILDKFTALEAELEAELEARQKQYNHYKKQLLSVPKEVPRVPLGTVADVFGGAPFESRYFNEVSEGVPLVRIRDINTGFSGTYYSGPFEERYKVEDGDMLISMDGDFKALRWTHGPAVLNQRVCRLQNFQDDIDPDYVFYLVRKGIKRIQGSTYASTVKHLSAKQIRAIEIPLLPLSEQRNVSGTLKLLDMMISDHIDGLPAEIVARRRQYEYYRDRLLSFEEAG